MADKQIPSRYEPHEVEAQRYAQWEKAGYFSPPTGKSAKDTYTIILPPPNVTGVLHMGHALTATLEDILVRRKRMQGFRTLWLPGTDHAGIATQMVVERQLLKEENKTRHDLGREKFLEKVWQWKEKSQGTILSQMRKIGSSCDWTRLSFTLDEIPALGVRECFVRLYDEGLIYRQLSMIQWCPRCRTALSDLEVKFEERKGHLWQIRYVLKDDSNKSLTIATTRPETLLGDTAVAVHPEDERYKAFHGKTLKLPLLDREIPIVLDEYVDREFGTGALKITPAHDPNDYEIGQRHKLATINIFDESATVNSAGGPYQGLKREKAREKVIEDLKAKGHLVDEKDYKHSVGHCDRCKTIVEPRVSWQWFVDAKELAKDAITAVESGKIKIVPKEWEKTYFEWMYNIRPWCISRQLWWGHRIPVWYCGDCDKVTVAVKDPTKCQHCQSSQLKQEEDVLDTWFSSGLWPLTTLGWPNDTEDLKAFYPTDVLETGFDILFFWVARMIMLGMKMKGDIPFHTVYLHPMVRDEYGQKMSKTKGNVKDPLDIISSIGADSLRYFFAANAYHGRDVRVTDGGLEGSRNFVNKIWNASRFVLMHFSDVKSENVDWENPVNQWIWSSLNETKTQVNRQLDEYRFFDAAQTLYHFLWDVYCSWFVEFIKSPEELEKRKAQKDSTAVQVLDEILRLMHPIMPFVTEEIWQHLPLPKSLESIMMAPYPQPEPKQDFPQSQARLNEVIAIVDGVRTYRGTSGLSPSTKITVIVVTEESRQKSLQEFVPLMEKLAGAGKLILQSKAAETKTHVMIALTGMKIFIPKEELGDLSAELDKKKKELASAEAAIARADAKLSSDSFVNKAPAQVVDGVKKQREELLAKVATLKSYLEENV